MNPGFQLIKLKISLPNTSKCICTLYRSPNSTNHELLFDHLSKSIDTITLHSPSSEIIILGLPTLHISLALLVVMQRPLPLCMTCHNKYQNPHVSLIAQGTKLIHSISFLHEAQIFTQTLLWILLLVTLIIALLPYNITLSPTRIDLSLLRKSSTIAKQTGTLFELFSLHNHGILASLMILPLLQPSSLTQFSLVWIFLFPPPIPGKEHSPKWFNSQCAKAVKAKNHSFKAWKHHQTPLSRASFVQAHNLCSKTINKASFVKRIKNKIASCQTGSRSFWSLAKVVSQYFCHSSFPPLQNNSG